MILGIAGGNGLEHIQKDKFEKVYGVDSMILICIRWKKDIRY